MSKLTNVRVYCDCCLVTKGDLDQLTQDPAKLGWRKLGARILICPACIDRVRQDLAAPAPESPP